MRTAATNRGRLSATRLAATLAICALSLFSGAGALEANEFNTELETKLGAAACMLESKESTPADYYRLTAEDLKTLEGREGLIEGVGKLKGKRFENWSEAKKEAGLSDAIWIELEPVLQESAKELEMVVLDDDAFELLTRMNVADDILGGLERLKRLRFNNEEKLRENVLSRVRTVEVERAAVAKALRCPDGSYTQRGTPKTADTAIAPTRDDSAPSGDRTDGQATVPVCGEPPSDKALEQIVDMVVGQRRKVTVFELGDDPFSALRGDPRFVELSDQDLAKLAPLTNVSFVNARLFDTAVTAWLGDDRKEETEQDNLCIRAAMVMQARKTWEARVSTPALSEGECACPGGLDKKTVYGFHPYWMSVGTSVPKEAPGAEATDTNADEDAQASSKPNFGLVSRIGYYSPLTLDGTGQLTARDPDWIRSWLTKGEGRKFVVEAHRYATDVDLVIRAEGWKEWDGAKTQQAVDSIVGHLREYKASLVGRTWREALGSLLLPSTLDGLVVHFVDYATGAPERGEKISTFVKALLLHGWDDTFELGLMLDEETGEETQARPNPDPLNGLLVSDERGASAQVRRLFTFLEQPTTQSKKEFRRVVEEEFNGKAEHRAQVLRKIIPVLAPNGHREQFQRADDKRPDYRQLYDDLVYFEDNFGGVAFWPMAGDEQKRVEKIVREVFVKTKHWDWRGEKQMMELAPDWCNFICIKRISFRIVALAILAVTVLVLVLAGLGCGINRIPWLLRWGLMGSVVILGLALLACDPFSKSITTWVLGAGFGLWLVYAAKKQLVPRPASQTPYRPR